MDFLKELFSVKFRWFASVVVSILGVITYQRQSYGKKVERLLALFLEQRSQSRELFCEAKTIKLLFFFDKNSVSILSRQSELVILFNMMAYILNKINDKPKWVVADSVRDDYLNEFNLLIPNELLWLSAIYFRHNNDITFIDLARKYQFFKEMKHFAQCSIEEAALLFNNEEFSLLNEDIYRADNYEKWQNWLSALKTFYHIN